MTVVYFASVSLFSPLRQTEAFYIRLEVLFKVRLAELVHFYFHEQFRGMMCMAIKVHMRVFYAQRRDDVNLLYLKQLTRLIYL